MSKKVVNDRCSASPDLDPEERRDLSKHDDNASSRNEARQNWNGHKFEEKPELEETDDEGVDAYRHGDSRCYAECNNIFSGCLNSR